VSSSLAARLSISITWTDLAAAASTVSIDILNMNRFAPLSFQQAGLVTGNPVDTLNSTGINSNGEIEGFFPMDGCARFYTSHRNGP
jgi:hypothetical protein